jgi:hypothetical protein
MCSSFSFCRCCIIFFVTSVALLLQLLPMKQLHVLQMYYITQLFMSLYLLLMCNCFLLLATCEGVKDIAVIASRRIAVVSAFVARMRMLL